MSETPAAGLESLAARSGEGEQTLPRLEWEVSLARRQPGKAAAALGIVGGLLIVIQALWGSSLWTGIAGALFFCAIGDFFFPLRLAVGPEGASSRGFFQRQRLSWNEVASCRAAEEGFWLERRRGRGLFVWAGEHGAEITRLIAHYRAGTPGEGS